MNNTSYDSSKTMLNSENLKVSVSHEGFRKPFMGTKR